MGHMKFEHTNPENNFGKKTINLVQGLATVVPNQRKFC
jgi:hypothetical protein